MELITEIKQFKLILEKTADQKYSSGCIMGYFNDAISDNIKIDKKDLYNNDANEFGLEVEPHVTVLYGTQDNDIKEDNVNNLLYLIPTFEIECTGISLFKKDEYEVVKFEIESDMLRKLNSLIQELFPYKSDYPDYKPHSTIAYVKPGEGEKYEEKFKETIKKKIDYWIYSKADGKKIKIIPGESIEVIRETRDKKEEDKKDE